MSIYRAAEELAYKVRDFISIKYCLTSIRSMVSFYLKLWFVMMKIVLFNDDSKNDKTMRWSIINIYVLDL